MLGIHPWAFLLLGSERKPSAGRQPAAHYANKPGFESSWHLQGWERLFRFLKPRCLISGGTWGKRQRPSRVPHPWVLHVDPNPAVFLKSTFSFGGDVLVSPGCCQRVPQTWWLRIPGIHCFQVLEASCVKSSCGQGWFSLAALRESQFQATIPASGGGPWCLLAGRHITPLSASMVTWPLHLTMSSILSLLRTAVIGFMSHLCYP